MNLRIIVAWIGSLLLGSIGMTWPIGTLAMDALAGLKDCRRIEEAAQRLACFDRESARLDEPTFAGRNGMVTDPFTIERPMRLRYQSDGAIFVMYLKTTHEDVVQNLHLGGGGEDTYLIETPGTYFLQVNGSESWRIWLEDIKSQR
jgi:hypothetical protein